MPGGHRLIDGLGGSEFNPPLRPPGTDHEGGVPVFGFFVRREPFVSQQIDQGGAGWQGRRDLRNFHAVGAGPRAAARRASSMA